MTNNYADQIRAEVADPTDPLARLSTWTDEERIEMAGKRVADRILADKRRTRSRRISWTVGLLLATFALGCSSGVYALGGADAGTLTCLAVIFAWSAAITLWTSEK